MKTLFSYFQQFSLPKVRKTRLQADFVTNNQILVVKIMKIRPLLLFRPSRLLDFMNFYDPSPPPFIKTPSSIRDLRVEAYIETNQTSITAQKIWFSIKDFFSKCDHILNGTLHFSCSAISESSDYEKLLD